MLVLSRHAGETICIGDAIRVTVLEVEPAGPAARLTIQAPNAIRLRNAPQPDALNGVPVALPVQSQIEIGGDVVVTLVDITLDKVRLGIDAPPEMPIYREEAYGAPVQNQQKSLKQLFGPLPFDAATDACDREGMAGKPLLRVRLARAVGEGIAVGDHIVITVLDIIGNEARLALRTPDLPFLDVPEERRETVGKTVKVMLSPGAGHFVARHVFLYIAAVEQCTVQLVIEAPEDLAILRKETWDRLHGR